MLTTASAGHQDGTVPRRTKHPQTQSLQLLDVPIPKPVKRYNLFMGGVDKSDQIIGYHRVIRQTVRYWKTLFYHLVEISLANAFITYKWQRMENHEKAVTESTFRDCLVLQLIAKYGTGVRIQATSPRIAHGSQFGAKKGNCCFCHANKTLRYCPDCEFSPSLCQTSDRDCHTAWHQPLNDKVRLSWTKRRAQRTRNTTRGRPKGSKKSGKKRIYGRIKKRSQNRQ